MYPACVSCRTQADFHDELARKYRGLEALASVSWVAVRGCRSLRAQLPGLIYQVSMNSLGVIGGQHIVPAAHPLSLINSLQHDLVEQLVGQRRDLAQVRQQRSTECVTSSAISVVEHFAAIDHRGVAFAGREALRGRIADRRRLGRPPAVQSKRDDTALIAVFESGAFRRERQKEHPSPAPYHPGNVLH